MNNYNNKNSSSSDNLSKYLSTLQGCDFDIFEREKLEKYSTMRVGGIARAVVFPKNVEAMLKIISELEQLKVPLYILGNGSNTLCSSAGFSGVVICTRKLNQVKFENVKCKRGLLKCKLPKLFYVFSKKGSVSGLKEQIHNDLMSLINNVNAKTTLVKQKIKYASCKNGCVLQNKLFYMKNNKNFRFYQNKYSFVPLLKNNAILVTAECGVKLPLLSKCVCDRGYTGFEFACGIPASVGGAVKMNAGAFGGQMADCVFRILVCNLKTQEVYYKYNAIFGKKLGKQFKSQQLSNISKEFFNNCDDKLWVAEYRKTNICDDELIISAELVFFRGDKKKIIKARDENNQKRALTQNVGFPSLGSVFKRNGNFIPSAFIDKCGLKGFTIGGAQVSKVHAGYVVNCNNATSDDILKLLKFIQNLICKFTNIVVQYEIKFLGDKLGDEDEKK